ncbi:MAG: hypothetical protein ABL949_13385 [Fimbriimonadaceae bacterium]
MKLAYVAIGLLMAVSGAFLAYDLVTNSGFNEIQTPKMGNWGVLGPALLFTGLVFVRFQGRRFAIRTLGVALTVGVAFQTLGLLPYVQPRLLAPTGGHAGMGMNEILTGLLMLGGVAGFGLSMVCLLMARAEGP